MPVFAVRVILAVWLNFLPKEVDEFFFDDDENEEEENAEELSSQEPTYVGKGLEGKKPRMIGSFVDDHGWFDHRDKQIHPDELEDYDEENDYNDWCFRCGREGHYASSCYASKHIKGYYLN